MLPALALLTTGLVPVGAMLDLQSTPDITNIIQALAHQFSLETTQVLLAVNTTVIEISRVAYISTLMLGVLLYTTHLSGRYGKDLIKGGMVLAVLSEFVFPILVKI